MWGFQRLAAFKRLWQIVWAAVVLSRRSLNIFHMRQLFAPANMQ